jgi:hypothetical protein
MSQAMTNRIIVILRLNQIAAVGYARDTFLAKEKAKRFCLAHILTKKRRKN